MTSRSLDIDQVEQTVDNYREVARIRCCERTASATKSAGCEHGHPALNGPRFDARDERRAPPGLERRGRVPIAIERDDGAAPLAIAGKLRVDLDRER